MTTRELIRKFEMLVPGFAGFWNSSDNLFAHAEGSATLHGVCAGFSFFFEERAAELSAAQLDELFAEIEFYLRGLQAEDDPLDNALCTCFLENIAGTPAGQIARPHLGPKALWYFTAWE